MRVYFNKEFSYYVADVSEYFVLPDYVKTIEVAIYDEIASTLYTLEDAEKLAKTIVDLSTLKNYELNCDATRIVVTFIDDNYVEFWNSEWGGMNFSFEVKEKKK